MHEAHSTIDGRLYTAETFERQPQAVKLARNIRVATIAPLLGEAIGRTATESSVSSLFT